MPKERIVEQLGEQQLLLPQLIHAAVDANDRVKYLLTLLQSARGAAGTASMPTLRDERIACGIDDPSLDTVIAGSRAGTERYRIPHATELVARVFREVDTIRRTACRACGRAGRRATRAANAGPRRAGHGRRRRHRRQGAPAADGRCG